MSATDTQRLAELLASEAYRKHIDLEQYVRENTAILSQGTQQEILEIAQSIPTHTW